MLEACKVLVADPGAARGTVMRRAKRAMKEKEAMESVSLPRAYHTNGSSIT